MRWLMMMGACLAAAVVMADDAPAPARVIVNPPAEYGDAVRSWQGIPGVERAPGGRLWVTWYSGGPAEGDAANYALLATSGDDGKSWPPPVAVIQGPPGVRIGDPLPWLDPRGRLWIFYRQSTKGEVSAAPKWAGTCAIYTDEPDSASPQWSAPCVVAQGGILFGKPLVMDDGSWLAPFFMQGRSTLLGGVAEQDTSVIVSRDQGQTWSWLGGTSIPAHLRNFSEATLAVRRDGSVWMVIRTQQSLYESSSADGGRTWTSAQPIAGFEGPATRAHLRRLDSGALVLVYHQATRSAKGNFQRERLTAWLSDDDGRTWPHRLLLDERNRVSYPDATQAPDGRIYIAYDLGRYEAGQKQILLSVVREEDIRAGGVRSPDARLAIVVNQATGPTQKNAQ